MTVERARILKGGRIGTGAGNGGAPVTQTDRDDVMVARRMPAVVVDAHARAAKIVADATARAEDLTREAAAKATAMAEQLGREAREQEIARVAAEVLAVRAGAERRAEKELDRTIELAVLLAERLVGEALAVDPTRIGALALDALKETRGARQMRIEASPADVEALRELLASLGEGVATVDATAELARGSLVVHTELGRIDARLAPQLARLADALREVLRGKSHGGSLG
jgi:flagellar biosynthesis/type III secretory pathway protein FliH